MKQYLTKRIVRVLAMAAFGLGAGLGNAIAQTPSQPDLSAELVRLAAQGVASRKVLARNKELRERDIALTQAAKAIVGKRMEELKARFIADYDNPYAERTVADAPTIPIGRRPYAWADVQTTLADMPTEIQANGDFKISLKMVSRTVIADYFVAMKQPSKCYDTHRQEWARTAQVVTRSGNLMTGRYSDTMQVINSRQNSGDYLTRPGRCSEGGGIGVE